MLPYAYVMPKDKDIQRIRPIVSYFKHPLKRLLNMAARAVLLVLKRADVSSFTLWKTGDFTATLSDITERLRVFGRDTRFAVGLGDSRICIQNFRMMP